MQYILLSFYTRTIPTLSEETRNSQDIFQRDYNNNVSRTSLHMHCFRPTENSSYLKTKAIFGCFASIS